MTQFKKGDRVRLINGHVHEGEERTISSGPDFDGIYTLGDTWAESSRMEPVTDRPKPQVGDRVRVVKAFEGVVSFVGNDGSIDVANRVVDGVRLVTAWASSKDTISVEILAPAEPEWQANDVVLDADGEVFFRRKATWRTSRGTFVNHRAPVRPLVLLVRDGKKAA